MATSPKPIDLAIPTGRLLLALVPLAAGALSLSLGYGANLNL